MSTVTCAQCGAQNTPTAQFCYSCGTALTQAGAPSPERQSYGPPQQPAYAPAAAPGSGLATASLILGIIALLAWLLPLLGFPIAVLGIIFGVMGRRGPKKGMATGGLVCSAIGLGLTLINGILGALIALSAMGEFM